MIECNLQGYQYRPPKMTLTDFFLDLSYKPLVMAEKTFQIMSSFQFLVQQHIDRLSTTSSIISLVSLGFENRMYKFGNTRCKTKEF